jgi:hypothetical protein
VALRSCHNLYRLLACKEVCDSCERINGERELHGVRRHPKIATRMNRVTYEYIRGCVQKFPDWPTGARATNGITLCH